MPDASDMDLVREYAESNSESAFAEFVRRHVDLVYSVALRFTGNSHDAEDVAQAVFIIFAKKAASLRAGTVLTGWIYETTRLTSLQFLRARARRHQHEQEAHMQSILETENPDAAWQQLRPLLEDAMSRLNEKDRTLLALRYFENRSAAQSAELLGIGEWAARKRAARALEKLRKYFSKQGVESTTTIIAGALSANAIQAAPVAIGKSITAVALAKGAASTGSTLTLVKGALKVMAWTKTKTAIVAGVAVLLIGGTATVTFKAVHRAALEKKIVWKLDWQALSNEPPVILIRPAQPIPGVYSGGGGSLGGTDSTGGKMIGLKNSVITMLLLAYQKSPMTEGFHPLRVVVSTKLPEEEYDFIACTPALQKGGLQQALKDKFNLVAHWESRETNALLLRVRRAGAPGLKINETSHSGASEEGQGRFTMRGGSLSLLANFLESNVLAVPVIDRTELTNSYDIDLTWTTKGRNWTVPKRPELNQILLDQLGLELVPSREPVDMLVIEKAK